MLSWTIVAPDDPRNFFDTCRGQIVPYEGSVCTFHMVSLKPHDRFMMIDLYMGDLSAALRQIQISGGVM